MRYKLGDWNGIPLYSYGTAFLVSAFACVAVLALLLRWRRQNLAPAVDLTILMLAGYSLGARVLYALLGGDWTFFIRFDPSKLQSGFWGGQIAYGALAVGYLAVTRAPVRPLADALALSWAAITVVHKIGCYLAGCCYGGETSVAWAVVFPTDGSCGLPDRPIHPTQLYDAASAFAAMLVLLVAYARRAVEGRLLLWWGLLYAVTKFASEWTRGDARFTVAGPLTAAMVVEIAAAAGVAWLLARPSLWERALDWHDQRPASRSVPAPAASRRAALLLSWGEVALACVGAALVGGRSGVALFAAILLLANLAGPALFGFRVVDAHARRASPVRRLVRGAASCVAPATFFGLFRPLFDARGRTLADAIAGTYLSRQPPPVPPVGPS